MLSLGNAAPSRVIACPDGTGRSRRRVARWRVAPPFPRQWCRLLFIQSGLSEEVEPPHAIPVPEQPYRAPGSQQPLSIKNPKTENTIIRTMVSSLIMEDNRTGHAGDFRAKPCRNRDGTAGARITATKDGWYGRKASGLSPRRLAGPAPRRGIHPLARHFVPPPQPRFVTGT